MHALLAVLAGFSMLAGPAAAAVLQVDAQADIYIPAMEPDGCPRSSFNGAPLPVFGVGGAYHGSLPPSPLLPAPAEANPWLCRADWGGERSMGEMPPFVAVRGGEVLLIRATGRISLNLGTGSDWNDADGSGAAVSESDNSGWGSLSGIAAPGAGYLVGVFVAAGGPAGNAPQMLDYLQQASTGFTKAAPQLDQVFFIGDGLTGDGTGAAQRFLVPPRAEKLYLGIADAGGYHGRPGFYFDNGGSYTVTVTRQAGLHRWIAAGIAGFGGLALAGLGWIFRRRG